MRPSQKPLSERLDEQAASGAKSAGSSREHREELMFCVLVGSVLDGWSKLDNCTGSIAEIRASDARLGEAAFAAMM